MDYRSNRWNGKLFTWYRQPLKAKDAKVNQLRVGGLIFSIIGFFIIWYMKKNGI